MKKTSKPLKIMRPKSRGEYRTSARPDMYPPVDSTRLTASAVESLKMLAQLNMLLSHIRDNRVFGSQLMDAAQKGNQAEVDRLIRSTGVSSKYTVKYNPEGIHLALQNEAAETPCCKLEITLVWNVF